MNILYDGYAFGSQPVGGISRYFIQLINRLPATYRPTVISVDPLMSLAGSLEHPNLAVGLHPLSDARPYRLRQWLSRRAIRKAYREARPQVFHPTYFELLSGDDMRSLGVPVVMTVYDMIHEVQAEIMDPTGTVAALKKTAIEQADALLCISEATRQDLIRFHPSAEAKSSVIYLASDFAPIPDPELAAGAPYLLFVGHRSYYKNFETCLRAFAVLAADHPDLRLITAGGKMLNDDEQRLMAELGVSDRVEQVLGISDEQLQSLYTEAAAFIFSSTYEGFGIPLLEAMRCGTPIVAADTPCFQEITGGAALLVPATDVSATVEAVRSILDSPSLSRDLSERGRVRAKSFNWEKMATETTAAYERLGGS